MIETERLILRNWRDGDMEPFDRHTNTPAVMRWLGGVKSAEQIGRIVQRFTEWQEQRGFTFWVVERKADGAMLGFCGLKFADAGSPVEGFYEVAWRFREDSWGQGYAKEAATASIDHAFARLGADQVVALTVEENEASWGLMKRLGMVRRPELDHSGPEWADGVVIVYSVGREEWQTRAS